MGRGDKLHNIMRLRGMSKVAGPRKRGWALAEVGGKNVSLSPMWMKFRRAFFSGCKLTGTKLCLVVDVVLCLACGWLRWLLLCRTCCSRISRSEPEASHAASGMSGMGDSVAVSLEGTECIHSFLNCCLGLPPLRLSESSPPLPLVPPEIQSCCEPHLSSWCTQLLFFHLMCNQDTLCNLVSSKSWHSGVCVCALMSSTLCWRPEDVKGLVSLQHLLELCDRVTKKLMTNNK